MDNELAIDLAHCADDLLPNIRSLERYLLRAHQDIPDAMKDALADIKNDLISVIDRVETHCGYDVDTGEYHA